MINHLLNLMNIETHIHSINIHRLKEYLILFNDSKNIGVTTLYLRLTWKKILFFSLVF